MAIGKKKIFYYFIVTLLILFWLTIAFVKTSFDRSNFAAFIVDSQSMKPTLSSGSLIIVNNQSNYSPGDIVTFVIKDNPNKNPITHRIFKSVNWNSQNMFATKGDSNFTVDSQLITSEEIIGKVIYQIPYLGMFIYTAQTKIGSFIYIIIPACLIIFIEVKNIFKTVKLKNKLKI